MSTPDSPDLDPRETAPGDLDPAELDGLEVNPPQAEPPPPPEPDPLVELALILDTTAGQQAAADLEPVLLSELTATAVSLARGAPAPEWLDRLGGLRLVLLQANARAQLALALQGTADVAGVLDAHERRFKALETLAGVRELLGEDFRSHAAVLQLADAQVEAGQLDAAVRTLTRALGRASKLAPGGRAKEAARSAVATMIRLARVHSALGHAEEAETWALGAVDMAKEPEDVDAATAALRELRG